MNLAETYTPLDLLQHDDEPTPVRERIGVLQLIDALWAGGAERVSVNLANWLPQERYRSFLCTTRKDGVLEKLVEPNVGRISLARQTSFDWQAVRRLVGYIRQNDIRILHAHSSTLFVANLASRFAPFPKVIWHVHQGRYATLSRTPWTLRQLIRRADAVIAVSQPLADWSCGALRVAPDCVSYIPNSVGSPATLPAHRLPQLPGTADARIVCVANLRQEKDHVNLIRAMTLVTRQVPQAHLLLVGAQPDAAYLQSIRQAIRYASLENSVSILGPREDISAILQVADIGVLSSISEGLPLTVLEYGMAGLPVVTTRVGQCEELLDHGRCGMLVSPSSPIELADALVSLLNCSQSRQQLGERLRQQVEANYGVARTMRLIDRVYDSVLKRNRR